MDNKKLINRLSRIQGQIDALKSALESTEFSEDKCLTNLQLLKASINGLKKFGAAYMSQNMRRCISEGMSKEEDEALMCLAIDTGFDI